MVNGWQRRMDMRPKVLPHLLTQMLPHKAGAPISVRFAPEMVHKLIVRIGQFTLDIRYTMVYTVYEMRKKETDANQNKGEKEMNTDDFAKWYARWLAGKRD